MTRRLGKRLILSGDMSNSKAMKLVALMTTLTLALIAAVLLHTRSRMPHTPPEEPAQSVRTDRKSIASELEYERKPARASVQADELDVGVDYDWHQALTNGIGPPKLPRAEVEKYLERNQRSAASLLAAARALGDTQHIKEAATNFPGDPRVQWSVLTHNLFPEERRKWLDLFKAAAPDNAAASYLSARDYFKEGQTDLAFNELIAATGKAGFDNYARESQLDDQELGMAAGRSSVQAMLSSGGWAQEMQFAELKALAQNIKSLETDYSNQGDAASVERVAQMGLTLASRLQTGDSGRFGISQLVGNAIEAIVLDPLDQSTAYDFLDGKSPAELRADFINQKNSLRDLRQVVIQALPDMTDAEIVSYLERQRIYGEIPAMRWLQGRLNGSAGEQNKR